MHENIIMMTIYIQFHVLYQYKYLCSCVVLVLTYFNCELNRLCDLLGSACVFSTDFWLWVIERQSACVVEHIYIVHMYIIYII